MRNIINVVLGLTLAVVALYNVSALSAVSETSANQLTTDFNYAGSGRVLISNSAGTCFFCTTGSTICTASTPGCK
jgi:hypothetical protein